MTVGALSRRATVSAALPEPVNDVQPAAARQVKRIGFVEVKVVGDGIEAEAFTFEEEEEGGTPAEPAP
jgi:hypothetical protein